MAIFVESSKIKVFPSAWRDTGIDPESTLNTEENITGLTSRISSRSSASYVVSFDRSTGDMAFVIAGYLFKVRRLGDMRTGGSPLWAQIKLISAIPNNNTEFSNLTLANIREDAVATLDANGEFQGIMFSTDEPSSGNNLHSLKLLDENGNVPEDSMLNLSTSQIQDGDSQTPITRAFHTGSLYADTMSVDSMRANRMDASNAFLSSIYTSNIEGTGSKLSLYASGITLSASMGIHLYGDIYAAGNMSIDGSLMVNASGIYANNISAAYSVTADAIYASASIHTYDLVASSAVRAYTLSATKSIYASQAHIQGNEGIWLGSNRISYVGTTMYLSAASYMSIYALDGININAYNRSLTVSGNNISLCYNASIASNGVCIYGNNVSGAAYLRAATGTHSYPTLTLPSFSGRLVAVHASSASAGDAATPVYINSAGMPCPVDDVHTRVLTGNYVARFLSYYDASTASFVPVGTSTLADVSVLVHNRCIEIFLDTSNAYFGTVVQNRGIRLNLRELVDVLDTWWGMPTETQRNYFTSWVQMTPQYATSNDGSLDNPAAYYSYGLTRHLEGSMSHLWQYTFANVPARSGDRYDLPIGICCHVVIPFNGSFSG